MNDDPALSFAARQRAPPPDAGDEQGGDGNARERPDEEGEAAVPSQEPSRQQKRRAGLVKKLQLVSHLQRSLDAIVFAYVCALYYMECSFPRLLLRLVPHYVFISPKETNFSLPAHRPHVFAIFAPNLLCIVFHLLLSLPRASEATRGYLHGGVLIDFVGQKPPTWKLGLVLFDMVIFGVQCLMLAVHQERETLRKVVIPSLQTTLGAQTVPVAQTESAEPAEPAVASETTQDHDAEERGVLRDETGMGENDDSVELQPLRGGAPESESRLGASYSQATVDPSDVMWSGTAVLSNFHVVHAVRTVGNDVQSAAAYSLQSLGYTASLAAAIAAERRARLSGRRQRPR